MSSKLQEMYDGWKNYLVPDEEMEPYIDSVAKYRESKCSVCLHASENVKSLKTALRPDKHCTLCGCTRAAKNRSLTSVCPDTPPRWGPVVVNKDTE